MTEYAATARTTLNRKPERGSHDKAAAHAILDAGVLCHIGYVDDGQPKVLPTVFWRAGERVYWHGSRASRALQAMAGAEVCFCVSHLDGLVLARSAFRHSAQYRSVIAFGVAQPVESEADKLRAAQTLIERLYPGRWTEIRPPSRAELAAVSVLSLELVEVSAKVREGPPIDADADLGLAVWAGVAPLSLAPGAGLRPGTPVPDYLAPWSAARSAAGR